MKFTKKIGSVDSIRKVWTDDRSKVIGICGLVSDMVASGRLNSDDPDIDDLDIEGVWCLIDHFGRIFEFASSRDGLFDDCEGG